MNHIRLVDHLDILRIPKASVPDEETQKIYEAMRAMALKYSTVIITPTHRPQDSFYGRHADVLHLFKSESSKGTASIELLKLRPSTEAFEFGIIDTEIKIS